MKLTNNRIVVDLRKVQWAQLKWKNQLGLCVRCKPSYPTVNGDIAWLKPAFPPHKDHPNETLLQRAERLKLLDMWTPVLVLELSANHRLTYSGKKALALWKAWNARIFGK